MYKLLINFLMFYYLITLIPTSTSLAWFIMRSSRHFYEMSRGTSGKACCSLRYHSILTSSTAQGTPVIKFLPFYISSALLSWPTCRPHRKVEAGVTLWDLCATSYGPYSCLLPLQHPASFLHSTDWAKMNYSPDILKGKGADAAAFLKRLYSTRTLSNPTKICVGAFVYAIISYMNVQSIPNRLFF